MSLSIFTNAASMASTNAMNKSNSLLSTAMERLGTGKRINSASDDAAGLQIATRLQGQTNGMTVAQRNISDATALLQTAEGAFDEVSNIMYRMKDLASQSANDTNTDKDRKAIDSELNELNSELSNIMKNTSYAGDKLFTGADSKFAKELSFQIGSSTDETMKIDLSASLKGGTTASGAMISSTGEFNGISNASGASRPGASGGYMNGTSIEISTAEGAKALMDNLQATLDSVGSVRSTLGANINRLGHTASNLANMKDNTDLALSNIQDADYATEASTMSRNQLLAQTSMSMLKQSNSMSSMVMSLLG
ncbi:flagellin [Kluyvera genomosp. 1]|uniref:flagellin N-terminal helical domain-containing protein n=1 Tax=Kluyvera genomosp. 1 TaxID=2774053 RepID=UPI00068BA7B9|nr:flagellin [Kluyvera genomosp. 1]